MQDKKINCVAIIQARMSSTRLPNKVLSDICGIPLIQHIVNRLKDCKLVDKIVVATSTEKSDDILYEYCHKNLIDSYRGSLKNVLSRFIQVTEKYKPKYVVRVTGDCPLIYPEFIDKQIYILNRDEGDLVKTNFDSSLLCGQGVLSTKTIKKVFEMSNDLEDFEHVGSKFIMKNPEKFKWVGLKLPKSFLKKNYRITVDEKKDLDFICMIYEELWDRKKNIDFNELISWLDSNKKIKSINSSVEDSLINQSIKELRKDLEINLVSNYDWDKA